MGEVIPPNYQWPPVSITSPEGDFLQREDRRLGAKPPTHTFNEPLLFFTLWNLPLDIAHQRMIKRLREVQRLP